MDDLISRQNAIDVALEFLVEFYGGAFDEELQKMLKKRLETLSSAQQWIPCSERLPEDGRPVLLYAWNVHHVIARYSEFRTESGYKNIWVTADAWNGNTEIKDRVIAWMPLPQPYGERREDEQIY